MQLGTGDNFNVTLNLSGLILLGLGLSTALLAYMFLNAFGKDDNGSTGYGYESSGYGSDYYHRRGGWSINSRRGKVIILCYSNLSNLLKRFACVDCYKWLVAERDKPVISN